MTYFQGFVVPVRVANRQAYLDLARKAAPAFAEHGASRHVECWGDEIMPGKLTDFGKAVAAGEDEAIVFSWITWPDRATCDAASPQLLADARLAPDGAPPFDGARATSAGFEIVLDTGAHGDCGYVDGMVASVADGERQRFVDHATASAALFRERGALRLVDGWGADVPDGATTDLKRAVRAKDGETVVFGWIEWPDKPTRDAGMAALMRDPRMRATPPPWNGALAIFGGFVPILATEHGK